MSFILIALFFIFSGCEQDEQTQQTHTQKPSVERTSENTLSAKVAAVDYDARSLTIEDADGVSHTFTNIEPDIPLEKFETGETITMTLSRKEINYVVEAGSEIPKDEAMRAVGSKKSDQKNIVLVETQNMTTTVKEVDAANRMATLLMDDGTPMTLPVQDDVENLENLEPGDKVVSQVVQLVSISVDQL